ncbi:PTS system IIA component (Glc family) [Anoxybacillus vitaminiphilus]|uniref:PTS system IIA component (Glc family) n=1 Tax=Paranoxybacillus vitaminiphilus TaxID=581036 RepID=A0A327YJN8_9BACL|nr:PTS glucose transporter subunit IIA [Anoxybacillus vitaminiphilus]RAK20517.1 PTS system IIA component (Glc family) [Anoxybacillus vitaminiphilus]
MLGKLFGKKEKKQTEAVFSPLTGKIIKMEDVPDPVFSQLMMGDGIAVEPAEGEVVAPVNGEIVQLFHTKHAVGLRSEAGLEILIHIGLETVTMNGEGFESHVQPGEKVKAGQRLITLDLELVKQKAKSTITPIVITNGELVAEMNKTKEINAVKGETILLNIQVK